MTCFAHTQPFDSSCRGFAALSSFKTPVLAALLTFGSAVAATAAPFVWETATPESQGLSTAKLDALRDELAPRNTAALLVVRNDKIVYEWYAPGTTAKTLLGSASTAKALVGGMAAAVELTDGIINLNDLASKYIPQWKQDPLKSKITVRELGSHTSGLDDAEGVGDTPHEKLTGWQGDFWKRLPVPNDPFTISRDITPMLFTPGQRESYSNPGIGMLAYALTAALRDAKAPQRDLRSLLRARVMRPIGVVDSDWEVGYGQTFTVDGLPLIGAWGGASDTARPLASVGRLVLHNGNWDGQQLLTPESVHAVTNCADFGLPGDVSIGWWTNNHGRIPEMPRDGYYAAGAGHRVVVVIPSLQTIVVRNGLPLSPTGNYWQVERRYLFTPMMVALGWTPTSPATPPRRTSTPAPSSRSWPPTSAPAPPSLISFAAASRALKT